MSKAIKIKWVSLCAYYQRQLPDSVIEMYFQDVSDLAEDQVLQALDHWRKNPKNRTVPLPAQIREMIKPENFDDDAVAREITARIIKAVDKFGYPSASDAKDFIGDIGWSVVSTYGGWESLCQNLGLEISLDSFNAQARELIKGRVKYGIAIADHASSLDYESKQERKEIGQSIANLISIKEVQK